MEKERLKKIFLKTDGYCHICHGKLNFGDYGSSNATTGWVIEHSIAKANGGTDHLNNLYSAHPTCNTKKGIKHTRTARSKHGKTRAPLNYIKKKEIRDNNTAAGAFLGGGVGLIFGGPLGAAIGSLIGGAIGNDTSPRT